MRFFIVLEPTMAGPGIDLRFDRYGSESIDEYLEYERIVGGDDGGRLFSPAQYEAYKKKVIPLRMKNRLYVSWVSQKTGIECKQVGPETQCFCQHRYKQHKTDFEVIPTERPIKVPCEVRGCGCNSYTYVPKKGSQPIRCTCKHATEEHSVVGVKKCKKPSCGCKKFYSSFTCGCSDPCYNHRMVIETKEERSSRGKPIGRDVPYKAMGGLTGFSSLADGYTRLDNTGIGPLSETELERPIGSLDHPFLKMYEDMKRLDINKTDQNEAIQLYGTQEERDMAYFEKRYQEKLKAKKQESRAKAFQKKK